MTRVYLTIDDLWIETVHKLLEYGDEIESRVGKVKEIFSYGATLSHVEQTFLLNKRRKLSPAYACAEFLWYLSMTKDIKMIRAYAPQYHKFAENDFAFGAYGNRLKNNVDGPWNQIELLIEHLQENPASRQAIITLWNANDLLHAIIKDHKDLPCTLSLQFLIRQNKLHLIVTMRSNDAWLGLPYDIFAFTCLQWLIASILNIEPGSYTHQVGSMHLYEKNWIAAKESLESRYYSNEYRRLEHKWKWSRDASLFHWKMNVQNAITSEREIRMGGSRYSVSMIDVLFDAVMCCKTKWMIDYLGPKSSMLKEALKNINDGRK